MIPESSARLTPLSIFPPRSKYYDTLETLYKEAKGDSTVFHSNECVLMISKMLSKVYEDRSTFELSVKNMSYHPCMNGIGITKNDTCDLFSIRLYNLGKEMLCRSCQLQQTSQLRNTNRLVLNPTRKRPHTSMSPIDLTSSYNKYQQEHRVIQKKYSRLITRMEKKKTEFIIEDSSSAKEILVDVLNHLNKTWTHTKTDVTRLLMMVNLDADCKDSITEKEKEDCAEYICDNKKYAFVS